MGCRRAFTIVEVLIVILIIGLLVGLTVPAVNSVRRNARRADCLNRMRHLGRAIQSFEGAQNHYPGWVEGVRTPGASAPVPVPWAVVLLPELDRKDVYDHVLKSGNPNLPWIGELICPSDPDKRDTKNSWISFVVNAGMPDNPNLSPPDYPANGIFHNRSNPAVAVRVHARYVMQGDGLALTLLVSENLAAPTYGQSTPVQEYLNTMVFLHPEPTDPQAQLNGSEDRITAPGTQNYLLARPSSFHVGGFNVVFANGNGRFLSEQIDYEVYRELMTPRGAEAKDPQTGTDLNSWHIRLQQQDLNP